MSEYIPPAQKKKVVDYKQHPVYQAAVAQGVLGQAPDMYPMDIDAETLWRPYQQNKRHVIEDARLRSNLINAIGKQGTRNDASNVLGTQGINTMYVSTSPQMRVRPMDEISNLAAKLTESYAKIGTPAEVRKVAPTAAFTYDAQQQPVDLLTALKNHWVYPEDLEVSAGMDTSFTERPNEVLAAKAARDREYLLNRQQALQAKGGSLNPTELIRLAETEGQLKQYGAARYNYDSEGVLGTNLIPVSGNNYSTGYNLDKRNAGLLNEIGATTWGERIVRNAAEPSQIAISPGEIESIMANVVDPMDLTKPYNNKETNWRAGNVLNEFDYYGGHDILADEFQLTSYSDDVAAKLSRQAQTHQRNDNYAKYDDAAGFDGVSNADNLQVLRLGNDFDIDQRTFHIGRAEEHLDNLQGRLDQQQNYYKTLANAKWDDPEALALKQQQTLMGIKDLEDSIQRSKEKLVMAKGDPVERFEKDEYGNTIKVLRYPTQNVGTEFTKDLGVGRDDIRQVVNADEGISQRVVDNANTLAYVPRNEKGSVTGAGTIFNKYQPSASVDPLIFYANKARNTGNVIPLYQPGEIPLSDSTVDVAGHAKRLQEAAEASAENTEALKSVVPDVYYGRNAQAVRDSIASEEYSRGVVERLNPHLPGNAKIVMDQQQNIENLVAERPNLIAPAIAAQEQFLPTLGEKQFVPGAGFNRDLKVSVAALRKLGWTDEMIQENLDRLKQSDDTWVSRREAVLTNTPVEVPYTIPGIIGGSTEPSTNPIKTYPLASTFGENLDADKAPRRVLGYGETLQSIKNAEQLSSGKATPGAAKYLTPYAEPQLIFDVDAGNYDPYRGDTLSGMQILGDWDNKLKEVNAALSDYSQYSGDLTSDSFAVNTSDPTVTMLLERKNALEQNINALATQMEQRSLAQGLKQGEANLTNALRAEEVRDALRTSQDALPSTIAAEQLKAASALKQADLYVANPALQRPVETLDPTLQKAIKYKRAEQQAQDEFGRKIRSQLSQPLLQPEIDTPIIVTNPASPFLSEGVLANGYVEPVVADPLDSRYSNYIAPKSAITPGSYQLPDLGNGDLLFDPLVYAESLTPTLAKSAELSLPEYNQRIKSLQIQLANEPEVTHPRYKFLSDQLQRTKGERDALYSTQKREFIPARRGRIVNPVTTPITEDVVGQALAAKAATMDALKQDELATGYFPSVSVNRSTARPATYQGSKPPVEIQLQENYQPPQITTIKKALDNVLTDQVAATQQVADANATFNSAKAKANQPKIQGVLDSLVEQKAQQDAIEAVQTVAEKTPRNIPDSIPTGRFSNILSNLPRHALPVAAFAGAGILGGAYLGNQQRQRQMQQRQGLSANF